MIRVYLLSGWVCFNGVTSYVNMILVISKCDQNSIKSTQTNLIFLKQFILGSFYRGERLMLFTPTLKNPLIGSTISRGVTVESL